MKVTSIYQKAFLFLCFGIITLSLYILFLPGNFNEKALRILQDFNAITGNDVNIEAISDSNASPIDHSEWTILLSQHVDVFGQVNYLGIQKDSMNLNRYLKKLTDHPPSSQWSDNDKIAYWINAYNAFTIQLIIRHYPLTSIKDIAGTIPMVNSPWDLRFFKIGNVEFDLNTIEHKILRLDFEEPRIHFAINCASISCPHLRREAYEGDQLEFQLDDQAERFLNDPQKNKITPEAIHVSKIFTWFASDFTQQGTLQEFLSMSLGFDLREDAEVHYLDYDWGLNDVGSMQSN